MAYPHKWSPISYKSSAGQRKHIGQRPMLYRWTTQPTSRLPPSRLPPDSATALMAMYMLITVRCDSDLYSKSLHLCHWVSSNQATYDISRSWSSLGANSVSTDTVCYKLEGTRYTAYPGHATLKPTQCRYRKAAGACKLSCGSVLR